jgi:hypothetical protein
MDKDYLFTHALSIWRAIEAEGRAFPAINICVGVSGFGGEVEEKGRGIEGFLVPGRQSVQGIGSGNGGGGGGGGGGGMSTVDVLGKRKRDDEGIAKFFGKKDSQSTNAACGGHSTKADSMDQSPDLMEDDNMALLSDENDLEEDYMMETYLCSKCQKQISIIEMEIHEDYHVALELSRGSPVRAAALVGPAAAAKGKSVPSTTKKGRKEGKKEGRKGVEKGQTKLQFGV